MNSNSPTINSENLPQEPTQRGMLKSALLILMLTAIFGSISYAFIELNAAVMQLSVPESLWCGLAMSLAVVYYLFQKRKPTKEFE